MTKRLGTPHRCLGFKFTLFLSWPLCMVFGGQDRRNLSGSLLLHLRWPGFQVWKLERQGSAVDPKLARDLAKEKGDHKMHLANAKAEKSLATGTLLGRNDKSTTEKGSKYSHISSSFSLLHHPKMFRSSQGAMTVCILGVSSSVPYTGRCRWTDGSRKIVGKLPWKNLQ